MQPEAQAHPEVGQACEQSWMSTVLRELATSIELGYDLPSNGQDTDLVETRLHLIAACAVDIRAMRLCWRQGEKMRTETGHDDSQIDVSFMHSRMHARLSSLCHMQCDERPTNVCQKTGMQRSTPLVLTCVVVVSRARQ